MKLSDSLDQRFRPVGISNLNDNELQMVIENIKLPKSFFGFFLLFLIIISITEFGPPSLKKIPHSSLVGHKKEIKIGLKDQIVYPYMQQIQLLIHFDNNNNMTPFKLNCDLYIKRGNNFLNKKIHDITMSSLNSHIRATDQVSLFKSTNLNFSHIEAYITITGQLPSDSTLIVDWAFFNSSFSAFLILVRFSFSISIIFYVIIQCCRNNHVANREQKFTLFLSLFTVLYDDPFYIFQLFGTSSSQDLIHHFCLQLYLAYLIFYVISLLSHLTIQYDSSFFSSYIFPITYAIISLCLFLYSTFKSWKTFSFYNDKNIIIHERVLVLVFFITMLLFIFKSFITFNKIDQSLRPRFWRYFSLVTIFFVLLTLIYFLGKIHAFFIVPNAHGLQIIIPISLANIFTFLMLIEHSWYDNSIDESYFNTFDSEDKSDLVLDIDQ